MDRNDSGMLTEEEWLAEMKARIDNKLAEIEAEMKKTRELDLEDES